MYVFKCPEGAEKKKAPTPRNVKIHGVDVREVAILPDNISSRVESWRVEAWTRLDRNLKLDDITCRMHPTYRITNNTLQTRVGRFRAAFHLSKWVSGNPKSGPLEEKIVAAMVEKGIDPKANSTRGLTPGLIDPAQGEKGGRIPLPTKPTKKSGKEGQAEQENKSGNNQLNGERNYGSFPIPTAAAETPAIPSGPAQTGYLADQDFIDESDSPMSDAADKADPDFKPSEALGLDGGNHGVLLSGTEKARAQRESRVKAEESLQLLQQQSQLSAAKQEPKSKSGKGEIKKSESKKAENSGSGRVKKSGSERAKKARSENAKKSSSGQSHEPKVTQGESMLEQRNEPRMRSTEEPQNPRNENEPSGGYQGGDGEVALEQGGDSDMGGTEELVHSQLERFTNPGNGSEEVALAQDDNGVEAQEPQVELVGGQEVALAQGDNGVEAQEPQAELVGGVAQDGQAPHGEEQDGEVQHESKKEPRSELATLGYISEDIKSEPSTPVLSELPVPQAQYLDIDLGFTHRQGYDVSGGDETAELMARRDLLADTEWKEPFNWMTDLTEISNGEDCVRPMTNADWIDAMRYREPPIRNREDWLDIFTTINEMNERVNGLEDEPEIYNPNLPDVHHEITDADAEDAVPFVEDQHVRDYLPELDIDMQDYGEGVEDQKAETEAELVERMLEDFMRNQRDSRTSLRNIRNLPHTNFLLTYLG